MTRSFPPPLVPFPFPLAHSPSLPPSLSFLLFFSLSFCPHRSACVQGYVRSTTPAWYTKQEDGIEIENEEVDEFELLVFAHEPVTMIVDEQPLASCSSSPCRSIGKMTCGSPHSLQVIQHSDSDPPAQFAVLNFTVIEPTRTTAGEEEEEEENKEEEESLGSRQEDREGSLGNYVAVLFPPEDFCIDRADRGYVSLALTEEFFQLPASRKVILSMQVQVFCYLLHGALKPLPTSYTPARHGQMLLCHEYESELILEDGAARMKDKGGVEQEDCSAGGSCKHDLEEGFMLDIWILPKGCM
ncbi:hypothetical protein GUITHDRAFT_112253 [Guillardia theta CCMP2712]|uniref:Uncharacterized protein n=2 Tax=Guillardia theta TaxID=55529 RepID=L1IZ70_GUITC|nr:hypothetical protein GUITHDRAFT_112253 [Guillardia theta CCMP2712]EKX41541.1 hypothetical protein GUITHDRAFT_112253 [Guillardia theta CCMP2712]|eukprot:XP_005828521.1 hypothetical protein GUITHDRAFT_112253 [Guillardia theta CCMP2712]